MKKKVAILAVIVVAGALLAINASRHTDSQLNASNSVVETTQREPATPDEPAKAGFDASDIKDADAPQFRDQAEADRSNGRTFDGEAVYEVSVDIEGGLADFQEKFPELEVDYTQGSQAVPREAALPDEPAEGHGELYFVVNPEDPNKDLRWVSDEQIAEAEQLEDGSYKLADGIIVKKR